MSDVSFGRILDRKVLECRWPDIADRWLDFIPEIDPPGSEPSEGLSQFLGFVNVATRMGKSYDASVKEEVDGLREYVFREGVFLLHKAIHVSGYAELQVKNGYLTWSLADAYQSALFGAKSILSFCGLALAELENKAVLVDIFPKEEDTHKRRQTLKLRLLDDPAIQFTKFNMSFQHRHVWKLFQRILNVFQMDVWSAGYKQALTRLGAQEFAKQRNDLNYKNDFWLFDDLHELVIDPAFGTYPDSVDKSLVYESKSSFSIALSLSILNMALSLFNDISSKTHTLDDELRIITDKLTPVRHPLYTAAFA